MKGQAGKRDIIIEWSKCLTEMNRHLENYLLSLTTRNLRVELINGIKYLHREKLLSTNNHHSPLLVLKVKKKPSSVESQN